MATKGVRSERVPAERLPVARVSVDVPLPHLDRPFDYLVAADDDESAQPGVRVKVRFAGQLVTGFLLERVDSSPHGGKLAYLDKVVSPEQILDPEIAQVARAVADRYAGNLSDVLRLAVPPRHARVEAQPTKPPADNTPAPTDDDGRPTDPADDQIADPPDEQLADPAPAKDPTDPRPRDSADMRADGPPGAQDTVPAARQTARLAPAPAAAPAPGPAADPTPGSVAAPTPGAVAAPTPGSAADPTPGSVAAPTPGAVADPAPGSVAGLPPRPAAPTPGPAADPAPGSVASPPPAPAERMPGPAATPTPGPAAPTPGPVDRSLDAGGWSKYVAGPAFLRALAEGRNARAVWGALPGEDWACRIAEAAEATVRGGRGVVIVVADARDLDRVDRALGSVLGPGRHVALNAALGPAERYRRFLAASRHQVPVVVGTRAAMWAPVAKVGLVVIWDDGDDLHAEPRAPYPHAREVLLTRAQLADCAAMVAGFARTGEGQLLLETGWAREISAARDVLRDHAPAIAPTGDDPQLARDPGAATARLPSLAWQTARQALQAGAPVLVQVPRRGYLPSIACAECRTPARCPQCSGPLGLHGARDVPTCHWCGRAAAAYACPACGGRRLRASITGARRTAEELGRAFPGVPIRTSGKDEILDTVPADPAVVVATPGAEPVAAEGYGAVLLLDTWALLTRSDLRAAEETMRRWLNAAALAKPSRRGGKVVVVADGSLAPVQALIRWDPAWFARRELTERRELAFPPASRMASLTGKADAVADFLTAARLPADTELLGPVPADEDQERMLLRVPRSQAAALAHAMHEAAAVRSAKKTTLPVRMEIDPSALF
ncbi:primosomal protein N' [Paractinoplanes maris]|uniref:primosomal protein N' family DNA-binding protein n=1 Tax=Paractinoplanes maris TaxID=1734446 RepID=UPI002021D98A|nr:primosomal protein N' [Actinoplanes maris]